MANEEQVKILRQGVEVWNKWRRENKTVEIDLTNADLNKANLVEANLEDAKLWKADLRSTNLSGAILSKADLSLSDCWRANLNGANLFKACVHAVNLRDAHLSNVYLCQANLREANLSAANVSRSYLWEADLTRAKLIEADLSNANFNFANLREADLSGASLEGTDLRANLTYANFRMAKTASTIFGGGGLGLSKTYGLEEVNHISPSTIGIDTLRQSKGKIPEKFLRGCGLSDMDIEYAKLYNTDLSNDEIVKIQYRLYDLRATQALQISPLFISYSHADSTFVDKLEKGLDEKGVRFWRDTHNMQAGKIETQIDRAIRQNPTVLLILSKNSMNSDWVQHEVRKACDLEKELGRDALCPIALDDGWKSSRWPQRVMEQVMEYNILDFSKWEDESTFQAKFAKLLSGLDLFYKKPEA